MNQYTLEELQNNVKIYVGDNEKPLKIEKLSDLIPYYPYIISSAYYNNTERKSVICLSSESFVDKEERKLLEFDLKQVLKIYNRCKRKKTEFNVEDVVEKFCWSDFNKDTITELANRVKENGKKATIVGLHLSMHEHYRQILVNEMLKNGLNITDYGYERFQKEGD